EAHTFDLYDDPMPNYAVLDKYLRHTSVTVFDLAARICGGPAEDAVHRAGLAYGVMGVLRFFALGASRRQLFVPVQMLTDSTASTLEGSTAAAEIFAGQKSSLLPNALGMLRGRARVHFEALEPLLPRTSAAAMPALLPAALVPAYLAVMARADYDPFRSDP